jgi:hypothetical protein
MSERCVWKVEFVDEMKEIGNIGMLLAEFELD